MRISPFSLLISGAFAIVKLNGIGTPIPIRGATSKTKVLGPSFFKSTLKTSTRPEKTPEANLRP